MSIVNGINKAIAIAKRVHFHNLNRLCALGALSTLASLRAIFFKVLDLTLNLTRHIRVQLAEPFQIVSC
jgi:hypothetical protein